MFEVLKNFLTHGEYTREDGQARIDYAVARGNITPEEAQELAVIAQERGATDTMAARVAALETQLAETNEAMHMILEGVTEDADAEDQTGTETEDPEV